MVINRTKLIEIPVLLHSQGEQIIAFFLSKGPMEVKVSVGVL